MPFNRGFDIVGDLQLTEDGRDLEFVSGGAKIVQSIRTRAQIFKGSWRYDRNVGVPYFEDILVHGASAELVRRRFYELIIGTDGVTAVTKLTLRFDSPNATVYVDFACVGNGELVNSVLEFAQVSGG